MAEEFSRLEATLVDAARQGNVEHVIALLRDVGRLHHLWQPSSVQAAAIANASRRVLRQPSADAGGTAAEHVTDLQVDAAAGAPAPSGQRRTGERLIKGYVVSSVNEWGADQTRILLLTDEAVHRVKYNFSTDEVVKWHTDSHDCIVRLEYGSFKASSESLTSFLCRRQIDDQQGFRLFTQAPTSRNGQGTSLESFREYRALLAEAEPWKEEVFMHEFVAAMQAIKILYQTKFEIKLTKMIKEIPGGVLALLHNANRRRQHGGT